MRRLQISVSLTNPGFNAGSAPAAVHGGPRPHRSLAAASSAYAQVLLAVEPQQLLVVHENALSSQHVAEPTVAEAPPLRRDLVNAPRCVSVHRCREPGHGIGPISMSCFS